jgi:antitoxin HicB
MPRDFAYAVMLEEDPAGGFVVSCPDFPELLTQGCDRADAIAQAADALEEVFAARIRRAEPIPEPSTPSEGIDAVVVRVPSIMAAKAALALALREAGIAQSALARTLGMDEKEIRRLLDPRHPSKLTSLQRALRALDKEVEIRVVSVARPEIIETQGRSYSELSENAEALAAQLFRKAVDAGKAIPVHEILSSSRLSKALGALVIFHTDPAIPEEAVAEHDGSSFTLRLRLDVRDGAREGNGRYRFTVAHELAHLVLHRDDLVRNRGRAFRDVVSPTDKLPPGVPIYRSPEWQANAWAGAFLMPLRGVRSYLRRLDEHGDEFTQAAFAANFQVSVQAATIRLEKLLPELVGRG